MKPIFVLAGILAVITTSATAEELLVVTALQPTFSIAARLSEGTRIAVANVPEVPVTMAGLTRVFARPEARTEELLAKADAVVSIGAVWMMSATGFSIQSGQLQCHAPSIVPMVPLPYSKATACSIISAWARLRAVPASRPT